MTAVPGAMPVHIPVSSTCTTVSSLLVQVRARLGSSAGRTWAVSCFPKPAISSTDSGRVTSVASQ